jgi:hypothetical protein
LVEGGSFVSVVELQRVGEGHDDPAIHELVAMDDGIRQFICICGWRYNYTP